MPLELTVHFRLSDSLCLTPPLAGLLLVALALAAVTDVRPDEEGLLPLVAAAGAETSSSSICTIIVTT